MSEGDGREYNSAEVCAAAGLSRSTFDAWLLRNYIPLKPGPGTGRSRTYSLLDATRIAVVAELTRIGISVGTAGRVASNLTDQEIDPTLERRNALVLASSPGPVAGKEDRKGPAWTISPFRTMADIEHMLRFRFAGGSPVGFLMLDVTAIAARTLAALENPGTTPAVGTWLDPENLEPPATPAVKAEQKWPRTKRKA